MDKKLNYLIQGDNLPILDAIANDYHEAIKLIYIDPPYNTGKKMGKYNDNFGSHEKWLDFIKPRLIKSVPLLTNDGVILISIGEKELFHLKLLCDEVFNERNFLSLIVWQSKYTVSNDKKGITSQTEYLLAYAKDKDSTSFNNEPLKDEYVKKSYKNPDNDPRGPWRGGVQLWKKKNPHEYTITSPNGKKWRKPWNYSEKNWYEKLVKENLLYYGPDGNSCPVKKVFLKDTKGRGIVNLWLGSEVGYTATGGNELEGITGERNDFIYPKPTAMLKKIIRFATKPDSIILDYFAGSGTTGQAVLECNKEDSSDRKFILINNNENEICSKVAFLRLNKIISGYKNKTNEHHIEGTGGSFVYLNMEINNET